MIKFTHLALTVGFILSIGFSPVYAETLESDNVATGSNSDNSVSTYVSSDTNISNSNEATIKNDFSVKADSGGNSASGNTGDAQIQTGQVDATVAVTTVGNVNSVDPGAINSDIGSAAANGATEASTNSVNSRTGSGSINTIDTKVTSRVSINNSNTAHVDNSIKADFNTGGNRADNNTGDAQITTGDIKTTMGVVNCLNFNFVNSDSKKIDLCVPTKEKPIGAPEAPEAPVPFVQESQPVVANVLAAATPTATPVVQVLSAQTLPATGPALSLGMLYALAGAVILLGLGVRQYAKQKLMLLPLQYSRNFSL